MVKKVVILKFIVTEVIILGVTVVLVDDGDTSYRHK